MTCACALTCSDASRHLLSSRPAAAAATTRRPSGDVITADGSSTVGPFTTKAAEDWKAAGGGDVTVGISGHRGRLRALLRGRDRHLERVARDRRGRGGALRGRTASSTSSSRSRPTRSRTSSTLENDWATCLTVEQLNAIWEPELEGARTGTRSTRRIPDVAAQALRRRHGLGHVRLLHRRHQRRGGREPHRLLRDRGRQRHRAGRLAATRARSATSASPTSRRTRTS